MSPGVLRTALRPASLGLLVIMLCAAVGFTFLGRWQLDRARERAAPQRTETVVALGRVLAPAAPFTSRADHQRVRAAGEWVAADTVLVPRSLHGRAGSYVVTALRVGAPGGAGARGALLPVVRGWVPAGASRAALPAPAAGRVRVEGRLLVSEDPQGVSGGRVSAVSSADLLTLWHPPLYTGYLVASVASAPLATVPAPAPARHWDLQNLSYAFQWWLFAAFAVVLWGKTVRDRHAADLAAAEEEAEAARSAAGGDGGDGADGGDGDPPRPWEDGPAGQPRHHPRPTQEVSP